MARLRCRKRWLWARTVTLEARSVWLWVRMACACMMIC
jgi:hypothetical protein